MIRPMGLDDLAFIYEACERAFNDAQDCLDEGDHEGFVAARMNHTAWGTLHFRIANEITLH